MTEIKLSLASQQDKPYGYKNTVLFSLFMFLSWTWTYSFAKIQSLLGKIKINFCCFSHNNINEIFVWDRFTLPSKRRGSMDIEPEYRRAKTYRLDCRLSYL